MKITHASLTYYGYVKAIQVVIKKLQCKVRWISLVKLLLQSEKYYFFCRLVSPILENFFSVFFSLLEPLTTTNLFLPSFSFLLFALNLYVFWIFTRVFLVGPASATSYKIGVVGNNWLVGWLVGWLVTQFSQKRLQAFFFNFLLEVRGLER